MLMDLDIICQAIWLTRFYIPDEGLREFMNCDDQNHLRSQTHSPFLYGLTYFYLCFFTFSRKLTSSGCLLQNPDDENPPSTRINIIQVKHPASVHYLYIPLRPFIGTIAQVVEQWIENPCVPVSNPGGTT